MFSASIRFGEDRYQQPKSDLEFQTVHSLYELLEAVLLLRGCQFLELLVRLVDLYLPTKNSPHPLAHTLLQAHLLTLLIDWSLSSDLSGHQNYLRMEEYLQLRMYQQLVPLPPLRLMVLQEFQD